MTRPALICVTGHALRPTIRIRLSECTNSGFNSRSLAKYRVAGGSAQATEPVRDVRAAVLRAGRTSAQFHSGLVRPERFELPASWFVARRSIQLSYGRKGQTAAFLVDYPGQRRPSFDQNGAVRT